MVNCSQSTVASRPISTWRMANRTVSLLSVAPVGVATENGPICSVAIAAVATVPEGSSCATVGIVSTTTESGVSVVTGRPCSRAICTLSRRSTRYRWDHWGRVEHGVGTGSRCGARLVGVYCGAEAVGVGDIVDAPEETVNISVSIRASLHVAGVALLATELPVAELVRRVVAKTVRLRWQGGSTVSLVRCAGRSSVVAAVASVAAVATVARALVSCCVVVECPSLGDEANEKQFCLG